MVFPVDSLALPKQVAKATSNNPAIISKIQFMFFVFFWSLRGTK
jgi:hypothetical protein